MRRTKKYYIACCNCDDIGFYNLYRYANRLWVTENSEKLFRIVGIFNGYDGNSWVAVVDVEHYTDRQLLLYSQFISRFKLVTEPRYISCYE